MERKIRLAFDVGSSAMKVALWRGKTLELHEVPLPENLMDGDTITMPHAFSGFLKAKRKELRLPGGPAALVLPRSRCLCRMVTLPRMTIEHLELNLPYEFNDFMHDDPSKYYCDYAVCRRQEPAGEEDPQEMTLMTAAVERQLVQDAIRMFADGGFSLRKILPQEMALIQLVQTRQAAHPDDSREFCFIDLGQQSTMISLIQDDRLQAERQVPVGCRDLDEAVGEALHIDARLADSYKRANQEDVLHHPLCCGVYDRIAVETLKVINFYRYTYRQNQLQGVYLIGGGANVQILRETLAERIDLPVLPVTDLVPAGFSPGLESSCAYAAGAAVRMEEVSGR